MPQPLLRVTDLTVRYGEIRAVDGISFEVRAGEIVTLIGANGAGKSTTLRALSGLVRAERGRIEFDGEDTTHLPPHEIVRRGISHVPEGRGIFTNLTVLENLELAAYRHPSPRQRLRECLPMIFDLFPRLRERLKQPGATLSGGEQQMLAFARALVTGGRLLLMDEPSMGLAPKLVTEIFRVIQEVNRQGVTILLVEQNAYQALAVAHRAYVLETGRVALHGNPAELRESEEVKRAYLGG